MLSMSGGMSRKLDDWIEGMPKDRRVLVDHCDYCGEEIYEGETVRRLGKHFVCSDCVEKANFYELARWLREHHEIERFEGGNAEILDQFGFDEEVAAA